MRVFALSLLPAALIAASAAFAQSAPPMTPPAPTPAPPSSTQPISIYDALGIKAPGHRGAELAAAVRAAEGQPLGSATNPVRTRGIAGQRAYLARLRCADGKPPRVLGRFTGPMSPFGGVGDIYGIACAGRPEQNVAMDLYHEHVEVRPVPGFTIVAP